MTLPNRMAKAIIEAGQKHSTGHVLIFDEDNLTKLIHHMLYEGGDADKAKVERQESLAASLTR